MTDMKPALPNIRGADMPPRNENDFYPTLHSAAVPALLKVERPHLMKEGRAPRIWECAAGEGHMADALRAAGFRVIESDIDTYGRRGVRRADFFDVMRPMAAASITNPPFNIAGRWIVHALGVLKIGYMALLLKADFFHAARRIDLWDAFTPVAVYPIAFRIDFTGGGNSNMPVSWTVWDVTRPPLPDACRPLQDPDRKRPHCADLDHLKQFEGGDL